MMGSPTPLVVQQRTMTAPVVVVIDVCLICLVKGQVHKVVMVSIGPVHFVV